VSEPDIWRASEESRAVFERAAERYAEYRRVVMRELATSTSPRRVPHDGVAWCASRIDANRLGHGAKPAHRLGMDWKRTANSMLDAFRAHELNMVTAEMARIEEALK
jgi:hypothetical protein